MGLYIVYNPIYNKQQKGHNAILNNKRNKIRQHR